MSIKEYVVFSHNDLDALGSMLCFDYITPDIKKTYFHTNYANIPEIVDEILLYTSRNHYFLADKRIAQCYQHPGHRRWSLCQSQAYQQP